MTDNNTNISPAKTERNYGIDALRMLAMLLVVTAHILGPGGVLDGTDFMSPQYLAAWFLEIVAYCSVNCYALISGYVGIRSKYRYHSIVLLWLRVIFFTVGITIIFSVLVPGSVTLKDWIRALLPITNGNYWYFTAYFALFLFLPLLNPAINKLTQKQLAAVAVGLIFAFSFLQTLFPRDVFGVSSNAWWLIVLYVIGGYIGKYGLFKKSGSFLLSLMCFLMIMIMWLFKIIAEAGWLPILESLGGNYLIYHTSPPMLAAGILFLLLFERLRTSKAANKIIRFFAPASFSVYIIHCQPLLWNRFLEQQFSFCAKLAVPLEIASVLLAAVIIYILCTFIDLIREEIFKLLKLKRRISDMEDKYLEGLWD
ncbi:MAG: acyltransferase [Clostridium sp.]|nr:acyltransferase [Clostridium sp.]